jgi:hypothetical protein
MAADEDQPQPVVFEDGVVDDRVIGRLQLEAARDLVLRRVVARTAAERVDRLETRGGDEPRPRVLRHALGRPLNQRRAEGVVHRFFSRVEVAEDADESGEDAAGFGAIDLFDRIARRHRRSQLLDDFRIRRPLAEDE